MNREWGIPFPKDGSSSRGRLVPTVRRLAAETIAREALERVPRPVLDRLSGLMSYLPLASWLEKPAAERPPITQLCASRLFLQLLWVETSLGLHQYVNWLATGAPPELEEFAGLCLTLRRELVEACKAAGTAPVEAPAG